MTNSENTKDRKSLQIRRPNQLYTKQLKRHIEILYDVLAFNCYVKHPKDTEFKMSWVQLRDEYGINVSNKDLIKSHLQVLEDENLISDLETWVYGFSYKFENTFISHEDVLKPAQYTILDLRIMQQLSNISYRLYTLAYKFFDFTRNRKGETKYIEVEEFVKIFQQNVKGKSTVLEVKNRLMTQMRKEINALKEKFDLDIEILFQKFGKPVTHIKLKFHKVPKLKEIISRFINFNLVPKTKKRNYAKTEKEPTEFERSQKKMDKENRELRKNARTFAKKEFLTKVFFPKIMESTKKKFEAVRKWIETNYPEFELNSLQDAEHHFNYFFSRHGFYKAFSEGVLKENEDFTIVERRGRLMAVVEAKHPFISTIQEKIIVFKL